MSTLSGMSHRPSTTHADLLAVTGRTPSSRLDVVSATPSPSSGPSPPSQRHLDALATNGGEICGLCARWRQPEWAAARRIRDQACTSGPAHDHHCGTCAIAALADIKTRGDGSPVTTQGTIHGVRTRRAHSTLMRRRFASCTLGRVSSRTPSSNRAFALSAFTSQGSATVRSNAPRLISRR